jgi:hypothetical protein
MAKFETHYTALHNEEVENSYYLLAKVVGQTHFCPTLGRTKLPASVQITLSLIQQYSVDAP